MLGGLDRFTFRRVERRENQCTMQRQRQYRGEEEGHRDHMRWIVVEMQILIADIGHPIEVTPNAVGEAMSPCAHQHRPDHDQRHIGENRDTIGDGNVIPHAKLARYFCLAQRPGHKGPDRADGDHLPKPAFAHWREAQPIFEIRWRDIDQPGIPCPANRSAVEDQGGSDKAEKRAGHAKEPDIERPYPEIEQVPPYQGPAADAVFPLKA